MTNLDRKTLEYISHKVADLQAKAFKRFEGTGSAWRDYATGMDDAYREVFRVLSDVLSPIYYKE